MFIGCCAGAAPPRPTPTAASRPRSRSGRSARAAPPPRRRSGQMPHRTPARRRPRRRHWAYGGSPASAASNGISPLTAIVTSLLWSSATCSASATARWRASVRHTLTGPSQGRCPSDRSIEDRAAHAADQAAVAVTAEDTSLRRGSSQPRSGGSRRATSYVRSPRTTPCWPLTCTSDVPAGPSAAAGGDQRDPSVKAATARPRLSAGTGKHPPLTTDPWRAGSPPYALPCEDPPRGTRVGFSPQSRTGLHHFCRLSVVSDRWRIVDVDSMPWPHNPSKCRWVHRFKGILDHGASSLSARAAARDMALAPTPAEVAACGSHRADRRAACAVAVALLEGGDTSSEALADAVQLMESRTAAALYSLFADPIWCGSPR